MQLILVHIGKTLPDYFISCVHQVLLMNNSSSLMNNSSSLVNYSNDLKIFIVLSDGLIKNLKYYLSLLTTDPKNVEIICTSELDKHPDTDYLDYRNAVSRYNLGSFRDEFWISTTCRFFYIKACMNYFNIESAFHIENDIMIYTDLSSLKFPESCENSVFMVKDSPNRVIPSIMYFISRKSAESLCKHIRDVMTTSNQFMNDMNILASYKYLVEFSSDPEKCTDVIYDGAAIGQFLGGPDPRNLPGSENIINHLNNPLKNKFINETCTFKMTDYKVETRIENGMKYYFLKKQLLKKDAEKQLKIQNLHIHSKQLYQFSSVFDIQYTDIITGDRVIELCDYIFMTPDIFHFHKNTDHLNNRKIIVSSSLDEGQISKISEVLKKLNRPVRVFVYTHILNILLPIFEKLSDINFILYTHNSDHPFNLGIEIVPKNIIKVYAQNLNCKESDSDSNSDNDNDNDKDKDKDNDNDNTFMNILPIGQANSMWPHGSILDLYTIMKNTYFFKKTKNIYVNINISTYPYRKVILDAIKNNDNKENNKENWTLSGQKDYRSYLCELSTHRFCLCIRGNGIDTHRFWESLYLGVIPVIINNKETDMDNFVSHLKKLKLPFVEISEISNYSQNYFNNDLYEKYISDFGHPQLSNFLKIGNYAL
jgi:hypothetical protein